MDTGDLPLRSDRRYGQHPPDLPDPDPGACHRLAALNTPSMLSTPLSVIAGIVMGEFSVESGWFNSEVMLYMAFVAVANYTQPNFELGYAVKFMRIMLLILTAALDWVGFGIGCMILIVLLSTNKTLSGRNYLNVKKN